MTPPTASKPRPRPTSPMTGRERMLAALRLHPVDRPPVWFMRQAGRHLPGYRALRERCSFLDLCRDPEVNTLASCEPVERYGVDGLIVFNDILIPLRDMGMELDFLPAPRFGRLVADAIEAYSLGQPVYDDSADVCRCLRAIRARAGFEPALLGFIGAPFTVAAFAVAGIGAQRSAPLAETVRVARDTFEAMQEQLLPVLASYAAAQVRAGADVIQVFESLADELPAELYREAGLPWLLRTVERLREDALGTPIIVFGRGMHRHAVEVARAGATALSLDHARPLAEARRELRAAGLTPALQGNLDPGALLLDPAGAACESRALLAQWRDIVPFPERADELGPTGWVFNLGHGVPADADPAAVRNAIDAVRSYPFPEARA